MAQALEAPPGLEHLAFWQLIHQLDEITHRGPRIARRFPGRDHRSVLGLQDVEKPLALERFRIDQLEDRAKVVCPQIDWSS